MESWTICLKATGQPCRIPRQALTSCLSCGAGSDRKRMDHMNVNRVNVKPDGELDHLFESYRAALPDPEASANFMPELWRRIRSEAHGSHECESGECEAGWRAGPSV